MSESSDDLDQRNLRAAPDPSRRSVLQAGAAGAAGFAAATVIGGYGGAAYAAGRRGPAARTIPFNGDWLFGSAAEGSADPGFDDSTFAQVALPHTVTELSWREWDPASWERVWSYRRHFDRPAQVDNHRVFVDFEAAMTAAAVTMNGRRLGAHVGGYLPFSFEITDDLHATGNVLAVALDSRFNVNVPPNRPEPFGPRVVDFWQPGGLYRPASLRVVPPVFLADVFAKPVDVLGSDRRLEVECTVDAAAVPDGDVRVEVKLRRNDRTVATATAPVTIEKTGQVAVALTMRGLDEVKLWDIDDPQLYDVVTTLSIGRNPVHDYATRVGFRQAEFTKQGFYLNGRRVKIFGLNRHQIYPYAGHSMAPRVQRADAEILRRDLNCNMVRGSHYPEADAFWDACDELGLLAWEESPGWGYYLGDEQWKARAVRQVGDMIRRHRNHPSIVIWGARVNETEDDVELWSKTRDLAHWLDDSRQTTGGMIGFLYETENFVQDVFSLNDYYRTGGQVMLRPSFTGDGQGQDQEVTRAAGHASLRPPRTDFPYLVSEAVGTLSGPAKYYRRDDPVESQQGQALAHAYVHDKSFSDDRYCGLLAWGAYDYPSGNGNQWRGVKYIGVADLFRVPKPGAAIYQAQVDPRVRPVIAPAFYWDFGPKSLPLGPGAEAMICSNCDRLELFVDDRHYATVHPDAKRFSHLPYPPSFVSLDVDGSIKPELRVDGYVGGVRIVTRRFSSDPAGDVLAVTADHEHLVADGVDATRVTFRALDAHGAPRPYVHGSVTVSVDGPGLLIGDSPFAFGDAGGVGAVWIRTKYRVSGRVKVTVSHPDLGSRTIAIDVDRLPRGERAHVDLALDSATELLRPGKRVPMTARLTNLDHKPLRDVALSLAVPGGWGVRPDAPTQFGRLSPGQTAEATWKVSVPAGTEPGGYRLAAHATYTSGTGGELSRASETFPVPAPAVPLRQEYDNVGSSGDSAVEAGDFDGVGNSYSRQALAAAGFAPGAAITHDGLTFAWPEVPAGEPDNVLAYGQTIAVSGAGDTIGFLGSGSTGTLNGSGAVYYSDGSISTFQITLYDWFFPPGAGNEVIARMSYLNSAGVGGRPKGQRDHDVYVFYASAPVTPGKEVVAVRLPEVASSVEGHSPAMHIFALALGTSTG